MPLGSKTCDGHEFSSLVLLENIRAEARFSPLCSSNRGLR
jgi:hypothetical protein